MHQEQGHYEEALRVYQEALGISRSVLGNRHPDVALQLNNMGTVSARAVGSDAVTSCDCAPGCAPQRMCTVWSGVRWCRVVLFDWIEGLYGAVCMSRADFLVRVMQAKCSGVW